MRRVILTLVAVSLAGWLAGSTSFATEVDTKSASESKKPAAQTSKKNKDKKKANEVETVPLCGAGSIALEPTTPVDGSWKAAKSGGSQACQPPPAGSGVLAQAGPVNTLEDIYVAADPPPAEPPPKH